MINNLNEFKFKLSKFGKQYFTFKRIFAMVGNLLKIWRRNCALQNFKARFFYKINELLYLQYYFFIILLMYYYFILLVCFINIFLNVLFNIYN